MAERSATAAPDLRALVRDIPGFPRPGIVFKDLTPLLLDPRALAATIQALAAPVGGLEVDFVVAAEARGFILGGALAREIGAGFIPARKPGKLPHATLSAEYALEYGVDALEVHSDAIAGHGRPGGARILVHDDLLATGGTARALCDLVEALGGSVVGCSFVVELGFLRGRERLAPFDVRSLIVYDAE